MREVKEKTEEIVTAGKKNKKFEKIRDGRLKKETTKKRETRETNMGKTQARQRIESKNKIRKCNWDKEKGERE